MDELYRSATLCVKASGPRADRWVVGFDNYRNDFDLDREGFASAFCAARGIAWISVVGSGNDWYHYPDTAVALAAIRRLVVGARTVMTYGSSMGGYAAIRFADRVRATAALALSPQYAIDPVRTPFEQRWRQEAIRIDWQPELDGRLGLGCVPVVAYDSRGTDRRHAELIAAQTRIRPIAIPFGGHPIATLLSSTGLLEPLVLQTLDGRIDTDAFATHARALSHGDTVYLSELAQRQPKARIRTALALAERALAVSPGAHNALNTLGQLLVKAGRPAAALPYFEEVMALSNRHVGYAVPYADALLAAGRKAQARAVAMEVVAAMPGIGHLLAWLATIEWRIGARKAALRNIAAAAALDPHDAVIAARRDKYESRIGLPWIR